MQYASIPFFHKHNQKQKSFKQTFTNCREFPKDLINKQSYLLMHMAYKKFKKYYTCQKQFIG